MFLKERWGPFLVETVFVGVLGVEGSDVGNLAEADLINAEKADFFDTAGAVVVSSSSSDSDDEDSEDEDSEDNSFVIDCDLPVSVGFDAFSSSWLLSDDDSLSDELSDVSVKWNSFVWSDLSPVSFNFFSGWDWDWCSDDSSDSDDSESEES